MILSHYCQNHHLLVLILKVRDSWEELLDVEDNWDAFLAKVR